MRRKDSEGEDELGLASSRTWRVSHTVSLPCISYLSLTHTPTRNRCRFGRHFWLEGRDRVAAAGNERERGALKSEI